MGHYFFDIQYKVRMVFKFIKQFYYYTYITDLYNCVACRWSVCSRSLILFYFVTDSLKWVKTSWTYSMQQSTGRFNNNWTW